MGGGIGLGGRAALAGLTALALLLGLGLLVPRGAVAKGAGTFTFPGGGPTFESAVRAGRYKLTLQAQKDGGVGVVISRGPHAENAYFTRGKVSEDGQIAADFGALGRVALSFVPKGPPQHQKFPFPGCRGKPSLVQHGVFAGTLRFRGEGGFVEARSSRVRGTSTTMHRQTCRESGGAGDPEERGSERLEEAELTASTPNGNLEFKAVGAHEKGGGDAAAALIASEVRRLGKVIEIRELSGRGHARAFEFDEGLTSATVRPGSPFEGTASFARGADGAVTWSGDLRADFLGGSEALTGGRIEASLERPETSSESSGGRRPFLANLTGSPVPIDR